MPAVQPRRKSADPVVPAARPIAAPETRRAPASASPTARLADELAVPTPSPVHLMQAELVQLTTPGEGRSEELYPGWLRLTFPIASSALMWAAILWGASRFA